MVARASSCSEGLNDALVSVRDILEARIRADGEVRGRVRIRMGCQQHLISC